MTITLQAVNELIASLESAGELSIREQKFLKLAKAFKQMAAENVALKAVFSQGEIPSEAVDAFMETAVMDHDWNETSEWSWVENETEVIHAVLDALKPETPATDRIVAGIKADAIDEAAVELDRVDTVASTRVIGFKLREFSQQLREGAK
ncbi:hypothetical protein [Klebsiella pneumoniae]|uniref:hypothetical protein n=1 Tax=Klebsiella pneumoniae TaxID=573 RepID=UPI001D0DF1A0|nr:hypothetical protein [Klebsiella pneumoniae]MCJ5928789.1 hypothetical protein [Klebsiella pneumoniae]MCP3094040.1 hypothetical protein [Klebsiella pneumoniae]MDE4652665.1 hypothetical protein [Klebsiella pneumoniae]